MPVLTSLGLGIAMCGLHSSAHYDLVPAARIWGSTAFSEAAPLAVGGTLELQGSLWKAETSVYRYGNGLARASGTVDLVAGTHGTAVRLGVGPAVALRTTHLTGSGLDVADAFLEPGVRARLGLDIPLGGHAVLQWHLGTATRTSGLDYDTGLGFGWRP